ncbi:MAG: FAD-dependent oxidoreductase [Clostridia bacterium]|nr:FAD-dependent oxidoreductase [Clostridia bacterium]
MTDIIIIGGGPSGLTAAVYACRSGKSVLLFEKLTYGGQIAKSARVENYPAISEIGGAQFSMNLYNQAKSFGCEFRNEKVEAVFDGDSKKVITSKGEYEAKAVIFALGTEERKSGLSNEDSYIGKGLSYCAFCDGNFFRKRDVMVVGGGNTAVQDALYLSELCGKVYLMHRRSEFRAEKNLVEKIRTKENVEIITDSVLHEIGGAPILKYVKIKDKVSENIREIPVNGLFLAIGQIPGTKQFSDILPLDGYGYVTVGEDCTVKDGIYVCGDCRRKDIRQLTTAVADGTVAATKAAEYVDSTVIGK